MRPRNVVLASMGVAIVCVLVWKIGSTIYAENERVEADIEQLKAIATASEVAACRRAGYVRPNWTLGGDIQYQGRFYTFHCEDERGRLFPVALPACNTNRATPAGGLFTDACRPLLPAASR